MLGESDAGGAATRATATPEAGSNDGGTKPGKSMKGKSPTELTKAELERARTGARLVARYLRVSGAKVSTDSNSPKSQVIKGLGSC